MNRILLSSASYSTPELRWDSSIAAAPRPKRAPPTPSPRRPHPTPKRETPEFKMAFQDVMRQRFEAVVQHATGRPVIGFMSGNQQDPDMICEVFVLSPTDLFKEYEARAAAEGDLCIHFLEDKFMNI
jgi:hypothetical protein